jgi:hypothetical protein
MLMPRLLFVVQWWKCFVEANKLFDSSFAVENVSRVVFLADVEEGGASC